MAWFVASIILAVRTPQEEQERIPVFENFVLIDAVDRETAWQKAEAMGLEEASAHDQATIMGSPARYEFLGLRKLRSVYNPAPLDIDGDRPLHGTELSHSFYEVRDIGAAKKLANGEAVEVVYIDDSKFEG